MSDVVVCCVLFVDACSLFNVLGVFVSILFFVVCSLCDVRCVLFVVCSLLCVVCFIVLVVWCWLCGVRCVLFVVRRWLSSAFGCAWSFVFVMSCRCELFVVRSCLLDESRCLFLLCLLSV